MLFIERSDTGREPLKMANREITRKRNKKSKKESEANRKICSLIIELIWREAIIFTKKQYDFSIKYIDWPINNFNSSRESPMSRWDKRTYRGGFAEKEMISEQN